MKKWAIATAVCMALTAFPFVSVKGETPTAIPAKAAGSTYADVLESIINDQRYGTTSFNLGSGYSVSDNAFALHDIDEDGQSELVIWWGATTNAGQMTVVYDKDASGNIFQKYVGNPKVMFCSNGILGVDAKNNQYGLTDDPEMFWPYSIYRSTSPTGKYELLCSVDAWSKDYRATDYNGNPFPTSVDKSNTGYVYYVSTPGSTAKQPLDYEEYLDKVRSLTGGFEVIKDVNFYYLTMQNVRTYCANAQTPSETQPTTTQTTATTTSTSTTSTTTTTPIATTVNTTEAVQEPKIQTTKLYADALESIYYNHELCGETFDPMGSVQDNQFAVCDVNGDGQEELLVRWTSGTLADTREAVFSRDASGKLFHMGDTNPYDGYGKQSYLTKYYSNGTAFSSWTSERFGMSGSQFWPFTLYQYNPATKTYEFKFSVRAWSLSYSATDSDRNLTYPYSADTSGTGMVYYITTMSNGDYVGGDIPRDVTEFQALFNQYTQGAAAIQPTYQPLTLGNIQTLRAKEATETTPVQTTETTTTSSTTTTTKATTATTKATTKTTTTTTTTTSTEAVSHSFGKSDKDCAIAIEQIEVPKDILEADGCQVPVLVKLDPNPGINAMEFGIECDYDYEIVDAKKYRDNKERLEPLFTSRAANSELEDGLDITMSYSKSAESGLSWLTWSSSEVDDTIENLVAVIVNVPETAQPGDVIHIRYRDYGSGAFPCSHVIQKHQFGITTDYVADYNFVGIDGFIKITGVSKQEQIPGDVNGNGIVNAEDAAEILIYAAARGAGASYENEAFSPECADVDENGSIDAADAANVLIYAAIAGSEGKADWDMVLGKSESAA